MSSQKPQDNEQPTDPMTTCREAVTDLIATYGLKNVLDALAPPPDGAISSPTAAFALSRPWRSQKQERLVALYLDTKNNLIGRPLTISKGSLNTTSTHPREIFRPAILRQAEAVVLMHNHPTGSTIPSLEDIQFTKTTKQAALLLGFHLHDHLIVSARGYTSMQAENML